MSEFFKSIPKIAYEGKHSKNPLAFKFYNPEEVIAGKTMREQLKFALSWWHTMGGDGTDMFGCGTTDKTWGCADASERAKAKVYAAFEIMEKLSIDYYCFHDRDLSPEYGSLGETNEKLKEIVDLCKKMQDKTGKKLLWGTAKCFDHPRFMHGAGTSPSADVFAFAAAQIKNAIDATVKLGGQGYVFWGGREGYETLLNTNMGLELDNMARLMHLTVDYARSIGYTGDFYVEPKPKEPTKHQYDFDSATVIGFLNKYGLDKDFKLNIEANHATLAQHTFQHELRVARTNGMFGSIDANQGDPLLGWDTDQHVRGSEGRRLHQRRSELRRQGKTRFLRAGGHLPQLHRWYGCIRTGSAHCRQADPGRQNRQVRRRPLCKLEHRHWCRNHRRQGFYGRSGKVRC